MPPVVHEHARFAQRAVSLALFPVTKRAVTLEQRIAVFNGRRRYGRLWRNSHSSTSRLLCPSLGKRLHELDHGPSLPVRKFVHSWHRGGPQTMRDGVVLM